MVHAREDPGDPNYHPYWYARIIGVFHANIYHTSPDGRITKGFQMKHFLWVRWFGWDLGPRRSVGHHLERIGFVTESDDTEPFGFLDPMDVIRACHLIPVFHYGRTSELLGPSLARRNPNENDDWQWYYVIRCAFYYLT
jgi:hypothetical protein